MTIVDTGEDDICIVVDKTIKKIVVRVPSIYLRLSGHKEDNKIEVVELQVTDVRLAISNIQPNTLIAAKSSFRLGYMTLPDRTQLVDGFTVDFDTE